MQEDSQKRGFRKVVASPPAQKVLNGKLINLLLENGTVVIAGGGGGVPMYANKDGSLDGIDVVIDKDGTSALIASGIPNSMLVIATEVEHVCLNFGKKNEKPLYEMIWGDAKKYLEKGHFAEGSMAPKIRAAIQFIESGGEEVLITSLEKIDEALRGVTGTWITR